MSTPRFVGEHILEAVVLDVTLATSDVIDARGLTHIYVYPDSGGSVKWSVVVDESATVHGPNPVTGATDEIQEIIVAGNFYLIEAITADCHAHPVFLNVNPTGGADLTVEDEGTPLTTAATKLDFAGAGVTATEPTPDEILVTIPSATFDAIGPVKDVQFAKRTVGNLTLNGTAWANLDTGLDLVLDAASGDIVIVGMSGRFQSENVAAFLDVASLVSASPVNYWAEDGAENSSSQGVQAWKGPNGVEVPFGGSIMRTLVSGDIAGGTLTLRFRARTFTASNKVLSASTNIPLDVWAINYGQTFGDRIGKIDHKRRASTDLTLNNTSWTNLDTGLDLVLAAEVGDVIEVHLNGGWQNEAVICGLDVVSIVAASPVNAWGQAGAEGAGNTGVQAWKGLSGVEGAIGGSVMRTVVSGDLSAGNLTLRFRFRTTTAANKVLSAVTANPLHVWAKNHGPVEV